jgi:hypothetical protein
MYSTDGQILMTYGPMASDSNGTGGFWYNTEATAAQVAAGQYFTYKGVKYAGSEFKGKYTPTLTAKVITSFKGQNNEGWESNTTSNPKLSFTNYARQLIGSTIIGVKDQSFENQLTSAMGQVGSAKVGTALALGVIKHVTLTIDSSNYWYTCVPTGLPVSDDYQTVLDSAIYNDFKYITGTEKSNKTTSKKIMPIFNYIINNGITGEYNNKQDYTKDLTGYTVKTLTEFMQNLGGRTRLQANTDGWSTAKTYITTLGLGSSNS